MSEMGEKGKQLGLWNLVGFGLGNAIGTGIFVMLGSGIAETGRSIFLAVMLASFVMLMTGWATIAMTNMFVVKGGDYGVKTMLFPPLVSGMSSWFTVFGGLGFSSQSVAVTSYLCVLFPGLEPHSTLVAVLYTLIVFAITVKGSHFLTVVENLITVVLVIALATFILFGLPNVDFGNFFSGSYDGGFFRNGFSGFIVGLSVIAYACQGAVAVANMSAVSKHPKRNVPLSAFLVTILLAVIYGLMAIVASGVLPFDQIAGQNISVTAEAIMPGALFAFFVVGGGVCAIASSSLTTLGNLRYPMTQIANDGWLPKVFKKTTKSGYPYVSYLLYFIFALIPLAMDMSLSSIVSLVMVPLNLLNTIACIYVFVIPNKYPEQWANRSIRLPKFVYYLFCCFGVICGLGISYNLFNNLLFNEKIICLLSLAAIVGFSALRIKQGAVDVNKMKENKEHIIAEAIAASDVD